MVSPMVASEEPSARLMLFLQVRFLRRGRESRPTLSGSRNQQRHQHSGKGRRAAPIFCNHHVDPPARIFFASSTTASSENQQQRDASMPAPGPDIAALAMRLAGRAGNEVIAVPDRLRIEEHTP